MELWRIADWLKNDKKTVEAKQSRQLGCTWALSGQTSTTRFGPMAGFVGCVLNLILECTFFWPQTDKVYLFLAASQKERYCHSTITYAEYISYFIYSARTKHWYTRSVWSQKRVQPGIESKHTPRAITRFDWPKTHIAPVSKGKWPTGTLAGD